MISLLLKTGLCMLGTRKPKLCGSSPWPKVWILCLIVHICPPVNCLNTWEARRFAWPSLFIDVEIGHWGVRQLLKDVFGVAFRDATHFEEVERSFRQLSSAFHRCSAGNAWCLAQCPLHEKPVLAVALFQQETALARRRLTPPAWLCVCQCPLCFQEWQAGSGWDPHHPIQEALRIPH